MGAKIVPLASWAVVRQEYSKLEQMGWQSVQQAARVGRTLVELKASTPHGEWNSHLTRALSLSKDAANMTASRLMRLAAHLSLLEKHKPNSQRAALALIPAKRKPNRKDNRETRTAEPPDEDEPEEPVTPEQYREAFDMRASTLREVVRAIEHYAQFGTPTRSMITELRAIARLIETVAQTLEERK